jgi:CheY-like chemotaxis protein
MTRILLIDDEAGLREEVTEWLTLEAYDVECAANGLEGLNLAFRNIPDLIICDVSMPEMDGYRVLLALKANPSTTAIPFIFVTAKASLDDIREGMHLGADDYITKPFTLTELLQTVESQLEKKSLQGSC